MSSETIRLRDRVLAAFLSVLLVLGLFPIPMLSIPSFATGTIEGVTITPNTTAADLVYTGEPRTLVTVSGLKVGDKVSYTVNGVSGEVKTATAENESILITATDPDTYTVSVTVKREDCEDRTQSGMVVAIAKAELGVTLTAAQNLVYDGSPKNLVEVSGLKDNEKIASTQWFVKAPGAGDYVLADSLPQGTGAGIYSVKLHASAANPVYYNDYDTEVTDIAIQPASVELGGLTITPAVGLTYDGQEHDALTVTGYDSASATYTLYRMGDDTKPNWIEWSTSPKVVAAGTHKYSFKLVPKDSANYQETKFTPDPVEVTVARASQTLAFNDTVLQSYEYSAGLTKDFSIKAGASGAVTYAVSSLVGTDVASVESSTGVVTIAKPGVFEVTATAAGGDNHEEASISRIVTVTAPSAGLVAFAGPAVNYVMNLTQTAAPANTAATTAGTGERIGWPTDRGTLSYTFVDSTSQDVAALYGLQIDSATGAVTVTSYADLAAALNAGVSSVTVKAVKTQSSDTVSPVDYHVYPGSTATYTLNLAYSAEDVSSVYSLSEPDTETHWFNIAHPAKVTVNEGKEAYTLSVDSVAAADFAEEKIIADGKDKACDLYIQNASGEIARVRLTGLNIDTVAPGSADYLDIEYSAPRHSLTDALLQTLTFGYYQPEKSAVPATVTFKAENGTSDIASFEWKYERTDGASTASYEQDTGTLDTLTDITGGKSATLTLKDEQYHGSFRFRATDAAGNVSNDWKTDTGHIVVVDTVAPQCTVTYADPKSSEDLGSGKQQRFFDDALDLTFTVTETNFDGNDFTVQVNGTDAAQYWQGDWSLRAEDNEQQNIWVRTLRLSSEGEYTVTASYKDHSDNDGFYKDPYSGDGDGVTSYVSDLLTIDKTLPVASFVYNQGGQSTTFTVTEKYFRAAELAVTGNAPTNLIQELHKQENWSKSGDVYTYTTANYSSGNYSFNLVQTDPAKNSSAPAEARFLIDHDAPSVPVITYSRSLRDTVLNAVTLGFYNPTVTITFSSSDAHSGVSSFTWSYTRQDGVSETNVLSYVNRTVSGSNASVTLPLETAAQIRGYIEVSATDSYGNVSAKKTDSGKIIVVDTISPTMSIEYSQESTRVGDAPYYGIETDGKIDVTWKITEANFFAEDVQILLSKNGEEQPLTPEWDDISVEEHVGRYTISGDGHYVLSMDYSDRSENKMQAYTSETMTIDTVKPVIDVTYRNEDVIHELADRDGHPVSYFDRAQTAVVTVNEHNFNAEDVVFHITAQDVTGAELDVDALTERSAWSSDGDVHTMTIAFNGDANYSLGIEYTDLAGNPAESYPTAYFTVDTVAPVVTAVEYSTDVSESVFESVTFGFYSAKARVTVTAEDVTSGVYGFVYNHLLAEGVSAVNQGLLEQAVEEASISYSDDRKTATMTFEVPREALGSGTQFNGTMEFDAFDRADNGVTQTETRRVIVDNIAPSAEITFNTPVSQNNGVSYYDGDVTGTITIREANFYSEDVVTTVTENGGAARTLAVAWSDSSADVHVGTFTLTEDADYVVTVSYRDRSGNIMPEYHSDPFTIDTAIEAPTFEINGNAHSEESGAYQNEATIAYSFSDQNFETYAIQLMRTRFDKVEDLTDTFVKTTTDGKGGSGTFSIPKEVGNDGIYLLTASMTDRAGHSVESYIKFTVNRYGSVYEYDSYLCELIKDGGRYVKLEGDADVAVTKDLIITEYNANKLLANSLNILITRDGEAIDVLYSSSPEKIDDRATVSAKGWYEYVYTINKENFAEDGVYKITISAEDAAGNTSTSVPENSIDGSGAGILDVMNFVVDTTLPEIRNIIHLDRGIADMDAIVDGKMNVKYSLMDIGGLAKVEVYLDGKLIAAVEDFENLSSFNGEFDIAEKDVAQAVRLVVTDIAGNVTDTDDAAFSTGGAYEFVKSVVVSTNAFVRWYRNTPLFWGSIGGAAAVAGGGAAFLARKSARKSKKSDKAEAEQSKV